MKCLYCAEEIRDEAQLCRFCGAWLVNGQWQSPAAPAFAAKERRNFTMLTTGWLLLISGILMLFGLSSPVPLFGAIHSGAPAVLYNSVFAAALLAMGFALAYRKPWAITATAAATAVYTIDKLLFIFDAAARHTYYIQSSLLKSLSVLFESEGGNILGTLDKALVAMNWGILAGWWGLAIYIYLKRGYFKPVRPAALN